LKNLELHQLPIESVREIGRRSTWWFVQECCITCQTPTTVFVPFATSCFRVVRCA
jgi:hypothetical protein